MKKKRLIIFGCTILFVLLAIGIVLVIGILNSSNLQSSSTITINGQTTVTYTAQKFVNEINSKIDEVYKITNTLNLTGEASSIGKVKIDQALKKLNEVDQFNKEVNNLQGKGNVEYKKQLDDWITGYTKLISDNATYIADRVDESGLPIEGADIDSMNQKLIELNQTSKILTDKLNTANQDFFNANN